MRWIFHIGYPKSASSSIQTSLIRAGGCFYAGRIRAGFDGPQGTKVVRGLLMQVSRLALPIPLIDRWKAEIEAKAAAAGADTVVVSDEDFSGLEAGRLPQERIEVLHQVFGADLHLVIVLRNHAALLRSIYAQKLRAGASLDFVSFALSLAMAEHSGFLANTRFAKVLRFCRQNGIRTKVLLFERIAAEAGYLDACFAELGIALAPLDRRRNVSPSDQVLEAMRHTNAERYGVGAKALFGAPIVSEIDRKILDLGAERFGVHSPWLARWSDEMRDDNLSRNERIAQTAPADSPIDWSLPDPLAAFLETAFARACSGLDDLTGESCGPHGYAV